MFLSKNPFGYYYIWLTDQRGKRKKVSTRVEHKVAFGRRISGILGRF